MNNDNISIVEPTVDYKKVPPIHQRRTIPFINHFITTTVTFLNKFSLNCENKLYEFENKLQKLEAAVIILESRLASIPGLEYKSNVTNVCKEQSYDSVKVSNYQESTNVKVLSPDINEITTSEIQMDQMNVISKHPLYEKYFKMVNVGVPKPAVKLKMVQEGLDPSLLDDPQQIIPKESSSTTD